MVGCFLILLFGVVAADKPISRKAEYPTVPVTVPTYPRVPAYPRVPVTRPTYQRVPAYPRVPVAIPTYPIVTARPSKFGAFKAKINSKKQAKHTLDSKILAGLLGVKLGILLF